MGMFDYIRCEYPLPENNPAWATEFQTKDLDCTLATYTITREGMLAGMPDFTGILDFYTNNITAAVGPELYTKDGSAAIYVDYRAMCVGGRITELIQTGYEVRPASKWGGFSDA